MKISEDKIQHSGLSIGISHYNIKRQPLVVWLTTTYTSDIQPVEYPHRLAKDVGLMLEALMKKVRRRKIQLCCSTPNPYDNNANQQQANPSGGLHVWDICMALDMEIVTQGVSLSNRNDNYLFMKEIRL